MSSPKNFLYNNVWQQIWAPGAKASPHGPESSPSQRLPGFGKEINGFLFFQPVTGAVDATVAVYTSPDAATWSLLKTVTWKPALGFYHFRVAADSMPSDAAWIQFRFSTANGTTLGLSSFMFISQLVKAPSGDPVKGGGIHFNGYDSGLLEGDGAGNRRELFDLKNKDDL